MAGIVSYGAYIPRYRIERKVIYGAMGWLNPATYLPGEKAVANYDEDSLTMAVAAGMDCLGSIDRGAIDASYFATTTAPYVERQGAQIISTALDLPTKIRTADFTDSVKAGTAALLSALDAADAGGLGNVMVCAADCRTGKAGSAQEEIFGDAAAALLIGNQQLIAEFIGSNSVSYDFVDHWRESGMNFDRQWEDRFIRDVGYKKFIIEAITGMLEKCGVEINEISKVVYPCLYAGDYKGIARKLGLEPSQVQEPMLTNVGFTGTSNPILLLIAALEDAKPGDKIAVASFGNGSDALLFKVTDAIETIKEKRRGVKRNLALRRELKSYEKMATFRGLIPVEKGIRGETVPFPSLSELWRSRTQVLGLCGSRCKVCGTPQFPAQKICVNPECGASGQMEKYRFSDKRGILLAYTGDNLAYSPNPPACYGIVDFEGGGRFWFDITDTDLESVKVGMEVEMSFRRKFVDEKFGVISYFWKAVPALD